MLKFIKKLFSGSDNNQFVGYPSTPKEYQEIYREYNEEQLKKSIELLGEKWIFHPNNRVKKRQLTAAEKRRICRKVYV